MAVTGASLSGIYDRLNNSSTRPMSASTFSDWSLEAGDKVIVTRDGQNYESTVHNSSMSWKGKTPTVEINSTGNEKRDAVSKAEKKKYNRGGSGVRNDENMYVYEVNQDNLLYEVYDTNGRLSKLQVTVNGLFHEVYDSEGRFSKLSNTVNGLFHEVYDSEGRFSKLSNTVDGLTHEVYDSEGRFSKLSNTVDGLKHEVYDSDGTVSYLMNTARGFETRISKVVDANGTIKSASIATAINGSSSEVYISADHVKVTGNLMISALMSGDGSGNLIVANNIYAGLNGVNYIQGKTLRLVGASSSQGADVQTLAAGDIKDMIIKANVSGNTLQLWKHGDSTTGDPTWTFNKAVSLSGAWSGTTYSVSATAGVISGQAPSTSVYLTVEGSPNPNATVYSKVYKDNPSVAANQLTETEMTLQESTSDKKVYLKVNVSGTSLTKGAVSTQSTYNNGWTYGQSQRERTAREATSQETTVKSLDMGDRWTIIDTYTKPDGSTSTVKYTVAAKEPTDSAIQIDNYHTQNTQPTAPSGGTITQAQNLWRAIKAGIDAGHGYCYFDAYVQDTNAKKRYWFAMN